MRRLYFNPSRHRPCRGPGVSGDYHRINSIFFNKLNRLRSSGRDRISPQDRGLGAAIAADQKHAMTLAPRHIAHLCNPKFKRREQFYRSNPDPLPADHRLVPASGMGLKALRLWRRQAKQVTGVAVRPPGASARPEPSASRTTKAKAASAGNLPPCALVTIGFPAKEVA